MPEATVIATGPGAPDKSGNIVPTSVKAGDRVLLPGWGGSVIKLGEEVRPDTQDTVIRELTRRVPSRSTSCSRTLKFLPRSTSKHAHASHLHSEIRSEEVMGFRE